MDRQPSPSARPRAPEAPSTARRAAPARQDPRSPGPDVRPPCPRGWAPEDRRRSGTAPHRCDSPSSRCWTTHSHRATSRDWRAADQVGVAASSLSRPRGFVLGPVLRVGNQVTHAEQVRRTRIVGPRDERSHPSARDLQAHPVHDDTGVVIATRVVIHLLGRHELPIGASCTDETQPNAQKRTSRLGTPACQVQAVQYLESTSQVDGAWSRSPTATPAATGPALILRTKCEWVP